MPGAGAIEVGGLRDLVRTFRELEPALARAWRAELLAVAEPVKVRAQQLAGLEITNLLSPTAEVDWWEMRVGVEARDGVVYVAPKQRGIKQGAGKRPNLAGLLLAQMDRALDENVPVIEARVELMVDGLIERYG